MDFHNIPLTEVYQQLDTSPDKGLSSDEARNRLAKYGPNQLKAEKKESPLMMFLEQFNSPVVWVLIGAVIVSGLLAEW
ncbi:MAG: hypothetical protein KJ574_00065, partial [Nanoarchaeota archaeon]|nr:hypothetical protein [Nanoarchaeota archaeon]